MQKLGIGRSGVEVQPLGLGCAPIGGLLHLDGQIISWGDVDDRESIRALHRAVELGITLFDTADVYGAGHSERLLGQAFSSCRPQVFIATKFGTCFDEDARAITGSNGSREYINRACDASLKRLNTDYIDLYQFHRGDYDLDRALEVRDTLEELVQAGKIRWYGWSTDDPVRAAIFAEGAHCTSIQLEMSVFRVSSETLDVCDTAGLAAIVRSPFAAGLLTGKYSQSSTFPDNDFRRLLDLREGPYGPQLEKLPALSPYLTEGGRSHVQGALAWIWARSSRALPIPGFKTVKQVEELAAALEYGLLSPSAMAAIDRILGEP